jgi:nucleoside 2-deoxyribosyltransferase
MVIYLIGSLRNKNIPLIANEIRKMGFEVFDDWFSPGPKADDYWREYEKTKTSSYKQALNGYAGKHIFEFDKHHLDRADIAILVMPAGKSCHLELGYMVGKNKKTYVLFDKEPDRWDIMYQFATDVFFSLEELEEELSKISNQPQEKTTVTVALDKKLTVK